MKKTSFLLKLNKFFKASPDFDTILAYQSKLPQSISVEINKDGDYFIGIVKKIDRSALPDGELLITESIDVENLVEMINDLVLEYLDFPANIRNGMPKLVPVEYIKAKEAKKAFSATGNLEFAKA